MKVLLIGFGNVGRGFVHILQQKANDYQQRLGMAFQLVGVATRSKGTLYHRQGLDLNALSATEGDLRAYVGEAQRDWDVARLIREGGADVLLEASPTDLQTGQPATDTCLLALQHGLHVVLANKGPVALHLPALQAAARAAGRQLRYEGTVMAGTPSITLALEALSGTTIASMRGIVNGTTNYILSEMSKGHPYSEALAQAQALGYAEADPTADVDGWDAAGKALILARIVYGATWGMEAIEVTGIRGISDTDVQLAATAGEVYKLIAEIRPDGARIAPQRLTAHDPLAAVAGGTNALTFRTDLLGDVTLIGAGAGGIVTGYALVQDLLALQRMGA